MTLNARRGAVVTRNSISRGLVTRGGNTQGKGRETGGAVVDESPWLAQKPRADNPCQQNISVGGKTKTSVIVAHSSTCSGCVWMLFRTQKGEKKKKGGVENDPQALTSSCGRHAKPCEVDKKSVARGLTGWEPDGNGAIKTRMGHAPRQLRKDKIVRGGTKVSRKRMQESYQLKGAALPSRRDCQHDAKSV